MKGFGLPEKISQITFKEEKIFPALLVILEKQQVRHFLLSYQHVKNVNVTLSTSLNVLVV